MSNGTDFLNDLKCLGMHDAQNNVWYSGKYENI
jgi:hypothetical protein